MNALATAPGVIAAPGKYYIGAKEVMEYLDCKENKPEKYYVIADSDREKYIERSILVNMTLLRKTASEKAQTGAILRVIRALLGIKGTYSKAELEKPFVVPTVTFAPDYTDPKVRSAMLQQGMNSIGYFRNVYSFNAEGEWLRCIW